MLQEIINFLPQNELVQLGRTCLKLNKLTNIKLYSRITVRKNPVLRSGLWYIDTNETVVSGLRSNLKRPDQNDYILYLKIDNLIESLQLKGGSKLKLIKEIIIQDEVFSDKSGNEKLEEFIQLINNNCSGTLQSFEILDYDLIKASPGGPNLTSQTINSLEAHINDSITKLSIILFKNMGELEIGESFNMNTLKDLKELVIHDEEFSGLRVLEKLNQSGVKNLSLKRLVLNHVHGLHDYNMVLRNLSLDDLVEVVDLSSLEELELCVGCECSDCDCLEVFMDTLVKLVPHLTKLSLIEKTYHKDHYLTENWDIIINRFLISLKTNCGNDLKLKYLSINHNPPINGKLLNGVEGNYIRRRTLYENSLPYLSSLEVLNSGTFLQTCSCYEVLVSDLLWNGCECEYCKDANMLDIFDQYLMNHQYYDEEETHFKDMIAPILFGITGNELSKRRDANYSSLDMLKSAPSETYWDFHGYSSITCFNDYECLFDESCFEPLVICVSHFLKSYIEYLVKVLPNLKVVILSNVYFYVGDGEISCVYDK